MEIIDTLGLMKENLTGDELWIHFFKEAKRQNLLPKVQEEVEKHYDDIR